MGEYDDFDTGGGGDPIFDTDPGGTDSPDPFNSSGMQVDPTSGDVYDKDGNFVGNINDPQFGGDQGLWDAKSGDTSGLSSLMKMLGLGGGGGSLMPLLAALGIGAGGYLNNKSINKGTGQMTDAIKQANETITNLLGGQKAAFQPYIDLGAKGAAELGALPPGSLGSRYTDIGSKFGPLGAGRGQTGPVTLASLMRKG